MLVLLLYGMALVLFESHLITMIVFHFCLLYLSLFSDVTFVKTGMICVKYINHSPLYPYNIMKSTLDLSNTVLSKLFLF